MYITEESAEDRKLRARFIAYLAAAFRHHKKKYCDKSNALQQYEILFEHPETISSSLQTNNDLYLPLIMHFENEALICAIHCLSARERYVLLSRGVGGFSFKEIAACLGMSYKGAAAIYYRAVDKIKRNMEVGV